jgi:hypothetical protein
VFKRRKNPVNENQGNPSIKSTRKMRTQVNTTQRKNKNKQSGKKRPYVKRTHDYKMKINDNKNKENLRQKSCDLSQID